jgi:uridine kinase
MFVIAVSSVSGGGKTTLVKKAAEKLGAGTLFFDDYASSSEYPNDFRHWIDGGGNLDQWKTPLFARDLTALRQGKCVNSPQDGAVIHPTDYLVIEQPLGRGQPEMAGLIDFVVAVRTPLDIALVRRTMRDLDLQSPMQLENATREELIKKLQAMRGYLKYFLDLYLEIERELYITIQDKVQRDADLILDGMQSTEKLADDLIQAVKEKRRLDQIEKMV